LQTYEESRKSRKPPTPVVGKKPNGKSQLKSQISSLFTEELCELICQSICHDWILALRLSRMWDIWLAMSFSEE
jgi:hypothetical protein